MGCGDKNCQNIDTNLHGSLQCHDMPTVTLSGDAEWPKVADAVIKAQLATGKPNGITHNENILTIY